MSKRISKEQLESDALVTSYYLTVTWLKQNKYAVTGVVVALFALVGGIAWYILNSQANEVNARNSLVFAETKFLQGEFETALYGDDDLLEPGLVDVTSRFPRTTAGNLAFYYAAVSELNLGNYESALNYIRSYRVPDGVMGVAPISLHGVILMQLGQYDEAVRVFERAANWDVNPSTTPYNLMMAAEAAHLAGNNRKAGDLVAKIKADYTDSPQLPQAQRLAGILAGN